jgi:hypothetical protein
MDSLYEASGEIYDIIKEIASAGYKNIDGKILEKLKHLREKAIGLDMAKGAKDIEKLIFAVKNYEEKNLETKNELSRRIMALKYYSENIIKYNDTSEL